MAPASDSGSGSGSDSASDGAVGGHAGGGAYFTGDRAAKYGWGVLRLTLICLFAFEVVPRVFLASGEDFREATLAQYLASFRWVGHAYLGCIGAGVNVQVVGLRGNLAMLSLAALVCAWDATHDPTLFVVLAKTFAGDFLAGKLDTAEWKLAVSFVFFVFGPALYFAAGAAAQTTLFAPYARIAPLLFAIQTVCEMGDRHLEYHPVVGVFFRYRYSFEIFTLAAMTVAFPGTGIFLPELWVVQHDLVQCLFYRVGNLAIIAQKQRWGRGLAVKFERVTRAALFRVFGWFRNQRIVVISDVKTGMAVLRASDNKGEGLERYLATPAWRPALSLESVDGELHDSMAKSFHALIKHLPPAAKAADIARRNVQAWTIATAEGETLGSVQSGGPAKRNRVVVSADVTRLSLATFIEYVFDRTWEPAFEIFVDAAFEWRKEIAVRGEADKAVQAAAVRLLVDDLLRNSALWDLHGEAWHDPRFYSIILQPFLISPAINVADVAVALADFPELNLEDAMRRAHPFPIFERYLDKDVVINGQTRVRAGTQAIMFTADFRDSDVPWPIFGAGSRMCGGSVLARGVLRAVEEGARMLGPDQFRPDIGHQHSGRNNDGTTTMAEAWYLVKTITPIMLGFRSSRRDDGKEALVKAATDALRRGEMMRVASGDRVRASS